MTRDEVMRMAREAGVFTPEGYCATVSIDVAERFAALVAAAEREVCAQVADNTHPVDWAFIGAAIRARGEKK